MNPFVAVGLNPRLNPQTYLEEAGEKRRSREVIIIILVCM